MFGATKNESNPAMGNRWSMCVVISSGQEHGKGTSGHENEEGSISDIGAFHCSSQAERNARCPLLYRAGGGGSECAKFGMAKFGAGDRLCTRPAQHAGPKMAFLLFSNFGIRVTSSA